MVSHRSRLLDQAVEAMKLYEKNVDADYKKCSVVHIFPAAVDHKVTLCCDIVVLQRMILIGGYTFEMHEYKHPSPQQWIHICATTKVQGNKLEVQPIVNINGLSYPSEEYQFTRGDIKGNWIYET